MSDIFISYARSTEEQAKQVEQALEARGYSVWRDDELPAHRSYADVIEERLKSAKAVVVIWSAEAVKSQWVRAEADAARAMGTLVQVGFDGTVPPMPFNQIQCASLKEWDGDVKTPAWKKVEASVAALAGTKDSEPGPSNGQRHRERSICVLPFANMSGDAEQEYFSDGISEDITTDLSKVSALAVTARNTAFTFKGEAVDVSDVARKLGVSHVLEGSVRKVGTRVRITAQLIDGKTGDHVWAERFDRDLTDIFAIQDEISKAIVAALKLKLLPDEKKAMEERGTTSAEAYNLYLMARQYWLTGNHGDPRREERVMRLCERAVEIDPDYAGAWALMALAQVNLRYAFNRTGIEPLTAAKRAITLEPGIAEAHCVIARDSSEKRDLERANAEIDIALKLDPESWEVRKEAARICMGQRRVADATVHYEKAVALMESDYHAWAQLATCYQAAGDERRVKRAAEMMLSQSEKVLEQDPSNGAALGIGAGGLAILGQADRAKEWIERALLIDPDNLNMRYNFACVLATYLGQYDEAIELLATALPKAGMVMVNIAAIDPDMDSLRGDPRFVEMLDAAKERLGIEAAPSPTAS